MSSIKVVNVNEETAKGSLNSNSVGVETKQEAVKEPEQIEEAKEEVVEHEVSCNTHEPTIEVVEDDVKLANSSHELCVKEEAVEKPKPKAKPKPTDRVDCNTCGKNLSYKNYRYRHEKICSEEPKPVKPQANPKGKSKPKVQPVIRQVDASASDEASRGYRDVVEEEQPTTKPKLSTPVSNQVLKPSNPLADLTNHYQLLQQQYIQQKRKNITTYVKICLFHEAKRNDSEFSKK